MKWMEEIGFFLYLIFLAKEDRKKQALSPGLLLAGAGGGLLLRIAELIAGEREGPEILLVYGTGLLWGLLLLLLTGLARQGIGKGDGLCFLTFALWKENAYIFSLLLLSVFLLACFGLLLIFFKKKTRKLSLPLMPFVLAAAVLLSLAEYIQAASR